MHGCCATFSLIGPAPSVAKAYGGMTTGEKKLSIASSHHALQQSVTSVIVCHHGCTGCEPVEATFNGESGRFFGKILTSTNSVISGYPIPCVLCSFLFGRIPGAALPYSAASSLPLWLR